MNTTPKPLALVNHIEEKKAAERRLTLEVSNKQRLAARDAITHCRNIKKQPMNVLVYFEFAQNQNNLSDDIDRIRKVVHYLRMLMQRDGNRESLLNWVRKATLDGVEQCYIITYCEDAKLVAFTKQVCSWSFEKLSVVPVDPEKQDRLKGDRYISLFEEMYAQTDHLTRHWIKDVYTEKGFPLRGPRTFCSLKLAKWKLVQHRRDAELAVKIAAANARKIV